MGSDELSGEASTSPRGSGRLQERHILSKGVRPLYLFRRVERTCVAGNGH